MIINDLNIVCAGLTPPKANSPLVVDPDAELTYTVAFEQFQPVTRRDLQIIEPSGDLKLPQFTSSDSRNIGKSLDAISISKCFSVATTERSDHNL